VSKQKVITGTIVFPEAAGLQKAVFDSFVQELGSRFRVQITAASDGVNRQLPSNGEQIVPAPPEEGNEKPKPQFETIPFSAVLTFQERGLDPPIRRFAKALQKVLHMAAQTAPLLATAPSPTAKAVGTSAAVILTALDELIAGHLTKTQADDLAKAAHTITASPSPWSDAKDLFKTWQQGDLKALQLDKATEKDWSDFIVKLQDFRNAHNLKTPTEPTPPLLLTQLMGWLTKSSTGGYGFHISGLTRFEDDAVDYGEDARFDIIGPDGSQLLSKRLAKKILSEWIEREGNSNVEVLVDESSDLRRAFERQSIRDDRGLYSHSVKGRLWLSDGSPFGIRTVAFFVPPAWAKAIDECCPDAEFANDDSDCCAGDNVLKDTIIRTPQALAVTETDDGGNFSFTYRSIAPISAENALLQVSGLRAALALQLVKPTAGSPQNGNTFPNPTLMQVDVRLLADRTDTKAIQWLDSEKEGGECGCQGGGLGFGQPDRTIDEFQFDIVVRTTDPMIVTAPLQLDDAAAAPDTLGQNTVDTLFRKAVGREAPIAWDYKPQLSQATTVCHGRVLSFKQVWRADGYSKGDLLYSLPLAPLQKKNIAIVDWDRSSSSSTISTQVNTESLYNRTDHDRDISEIANSVLNESVRGRSDSGGNSSSGGGGISILGLGFGGASGGSSSAWSSSSQDSTRSVAANFVNYLRDSTVQAANSFRGQRVTSVQQSDQSESASAMSETIANRNACHAVTIQYFEVLRHFRVDYDLSAVRECLYIPMPIEKFDRNKVLRWRSILTQYLPAQELVDALDACARLSENPYPGVLGAYADEQINDLEGEMELTLDFPYPNQTIDATTTWSTFFGITALVDGQLSVIFPSFRQIQESARAAYFESHIAPQLARAVVSSLSFVADDGGQTLPLRATLLTPYRAGGRHSVSVRSTGDVAPLGIKRKDLKGIRLSTKASSANDISVIINTIQLRARTDHLVSTILDRQNEDLGIPWSYPTGTSVPVRLATPLTPEELRNPEREDQRAEINLLRHLNGNVEYYHKAIWWRMDPDRRFTLLDGFLAPNAGGRSIASVVENRLVALVGNCLVMPVAPGIRLDYFEDVSESADNEDEKAGRGISEESAADRLFSLYRPLVQVPSTYHAIPTRGVYAESVMGACNSCEKIDNSRNWQYWQHPLPDDPTSIEPLSLASRASNDVQPPPPMAPPAINQVVNSLPQAPEPTGLSKVLETIVKSPGFADAMGLTGTQQNARDALDQSYATTTKFGESAAEITKQMNELAAQAVMTYLTGVPMLGGAQKAKESIGKDAAAGRITPDQAQRSIAKVNDAMADSLGVSQFRSVLEHPEVAAAVGAAAERGAPLSIAKGDTRVDVGRSSAPTAVQNASVVPSGWNLPWPLRLVFGKKEGSLAPPAPIANDKGAVTVIVTSDEELGKQFGSHAGLYLNNTSDGPVLYDPAGSYKSSARGSGAILTKGDDGATLSDYIKYQNSTGSKVSTVTIPVAVADQEKIYKNAQSIGDPRGLNCAVSLSTALKGVGPFKDLEITYLPGTLLREMRAIEGDQDRSQ